MQTPTRLVERPPATWPDRLPGRLWVPDDGDYSVHGLDRPQIGIVLHSGDKKRDVAGYVEREPDGGKKSYHFAWSLGPRAFVQMVSLRHRAWHAGNEGNDWIGIALPGPWYRVPREDEEFLDLWALIMQLQMAYNYSLHYWTRHSDISRKRKDPGPGVNARWCHMLSECGLTWVNFADNDVLPDEFYEQYEPKIDRFFK